MGEWEKTSHQSHNEERGRVLKTTSDNGMSGEKRHLAVTFLVICNSS